MSGPAARDLDGRIARAVDHHRAGRLVEAEAAWRDILADHPDYAPILHNLGVVVAETGRPADAVALFDRAIAVDPAYASAHFNRGGALRALGEAQAAIESYRRTVALEPDHYPAHRALAFLWQAEGRRDRALDHFARTMELRRGDDRIGIADESLHRTTRAKLRHDASQFRHIAERSRDGARFDFLARTYENVSRDIDDTVGGNDVVVLTADQLDALGEGYNAPFHLIDAPECRGGAVDPALDAAAISRDFDARAPGVAWFDGLLTQAALRRLQRYLLESTIWFDFTHIGGFLASYLEDGLACPLMLQIADEVRAAFPDILGGLALSQGWAFKAIAGDLPIALHADDAAVSLNFWVTPDAANRDSDHGGLIVCRAPPPEGWTIADYDADAGRIEAFVADHEEDRLVIPYRQNRAVLFDSRLFHGSDAPDFGPDYADHRINITLLYG